MATLKPKDAPDLSRFDWEDPFRLEGQLSEDERMMRDSARSYAQEKLQRIGLGVPDVLAAVKALRALGVEFVETEAAHTEQRGAISKTYLGSVVFELVHSQRSGA